MAMRFRGAAAALALLASGCVPVKPGASGASTRSCLSENAAFLEAWTCVRARLAARQKTEAHEDGLIDEGDILADQVRAGKVSEAEARKRLGAGLAHDPS